MNIFSVDLTIQELQLLRGSLDVITLAGKDAKFVASLQIKLESEIQQIANILNEEEIKKQQELEAIIAHEAKKKQKPANSAE
jgi:hypothetical protein